MILNSCAVKQKACEKFWDLWKNVWARATAETHHEIRDILYTATFPQGLITLFLCTTPDSGNGENGKI